MCLRALVAKEQGFYVFYCFSVLVAKNKLIFYRTTPETLLFPDCL